MSRKSEPERPIESPIPFHPCSNGEYAPGPPTRLAQRAEEAWRRIVEQQHRRLSMTRRQFAESASGVAAALFVLNQIACGKSPEIGASDAGAGPSPLRDASNATGRDASSATEADASTLDGGDDAGFYDVDAEMMDDPECAQQLLYDPDAFVLDVQTHVANPPLSAPWPQGSPSDKALDYIKQVFVQGGATVACLSGTPAARNPGASNMEARAQLRDVINRLGDDRLRLHCNLDFNSQDVSAEMDYMEMIAGSHPVGAWKVYPYRRPWLANQEQGLPFAAKAASLGAPLIAAHRGIANNGDYRHYGSPRDLVEAASQTPTVRYLCYHSGWEFGRAEDHPYDPMAPDDQTFGIDRLVRAVLEFNVPRNTGNVYAELGSTWHNLRASPLQAAHAIGKLLKYVGEDRILFGSDSVFNGAPQGQIAALRAFQIPTMLREQHGYPALTDEVRRKILGLNAAPLYGVDPMKARCVFGADDVDRLRMSFLDDPRSVPMPHPHRYLGPRTRREFLAFVRNERRLEHT